MQKNDHALPVYLRADPEQLNEAIASLKAKLNSCTYCPRNCNVDRVSGKKGACGAPDGAVIESAGPHFGEERELVGRGGSGTIFFPHCNLDCLFCQNWTISRGVAAGPPTTIDELAAAMMGLQKRGCHNINLVSPTPYLYPIAAAIRNAAAMGLRLPVVYNCGGYENASALKLLEGFIDIYMPDFKYGGNREGSLYSGIDDYFSRAGEALKEMQRQVGDLQVTADNIAYRGLLVRHLVMPENISGSEQVAAFLKREVSANCAVNVMAQYYPAYRAGEYQPLTRRITGAEYKKALDAFRLAGLRLL